MASVKLTFRKNALLAIAKLAVERKTGARGLRSILEGLLLDTLYEIPSTSSVKGVIIDKDVVNGKKKPVILHVSEGQSISSRKAS